MQLLKEFFHLCDGGICQDHLSESEKTAVKNKEQLFLTGLIQRADVKNGNGRVYSRKILEREIESYKRLIREKRALGETDHPETDEVILTRASHIIEDIWWEGNDVWGKIRILKKHPAGKVLESLIEEGVQLGISSRGVGSITETNEGIKVDDDFRLICFDVVHEPSTKNAFLYKESKQGDKIDKDEKIYRLLWDILEK